MTHSLIDARRGLFAHCVVRVDGERLGTGVFVSADEVLTATHVVGSERSTAQVTWQERTVDCEVIEHIATGERPVADLSPWPDLTLLRVPVGEFVHHPCVQLGPDDDGVNGPALTYGHPREGSSIQLSSRALTPRGGHARRTHDSFYYDGFMGDDVDAGFSGAPLLQGRCVDHLVVATRDPTTAKGCLAIRLSELVQLEELRARNADFHRTDTRWADAEPRDRRPLWAAAAAGLVVLTIATLLIVWPGSPTPDPTVARGALGIGVAPVDDAPGVAELIETALDDLRTDDRLRAEAQECGITPRPLQIVGADALGDVPPSETNDWLNLSAIVHSSAAAGASENERRVSADVEFLAHPIRTGTDPILFAGLTLEPADIDLDDNRSAFERFPELRTLPLVVAGLVELNESSLEALAAGRCAFESANAALEGEGGARLAEFRAALHVLTAITWIREESLLPGGDGDGCAPDTTPLECSQASLDAARAEGPSNRTDAVIAANEVGIQFLELLDEDGNLADGVTPDDARAAAQQFVEVGRRAGQSPAGIVLTSTLAAKTTLAGAIQIIGETQACAADSDAAVYLDEAERLARSATEIADSTVAMYRADAFATLGVLAVERCDAKAAAEAFSTAAGLARGVPRQQLRLLQASSLALVDGPETKAQVAELLDGVARFLDGSPDPALACSFNQAIDDLAPGQSPRSECTDN